MTLTDDRSGETPSLETGHWYGPIIPGKSYVYETENFYWGRGTFIWMQDLGRLALLSTTHLQGGETDATPPSGHSLETFHALQIQGKIFLIDLPTERHLGNPAFVSLRLEAEAQEQPD